jgi:hypothetical protein
VISWWQPPATTLAVERALVNSLRSADLRPLTPNSGPNFWDGRYLGAVVESALRSRRLTSKELGHVIMCAYGAPRGGIFNGRVLRDVPSRGQCLTCCVPASHWRVQSVVATPF